MIRTMPISVQPHSMHDRRPRWSHSHMAIARLKVYDMKFPPASKAGSFPVKPPSANISGA